MDERHEITLRDADAPAEPSFARELRQLAEELCDSSFKGGSSWIRGKGQAELAKAAEIKARVMASLAGMENERQRLIAERDSVVMQHAERMYALRTEHFKAVCDSVCRLRELGVEINMTVLEGALRQLECR